MTVIGPSRPSVWFLFCETSFSTYSLRHGSTFACPVKFVAVALIP